MKLAIVVGTRPEIIKMSPIVHRLLLVESLDWRFIHTWQHYSPELDQIFFEELDLPLPDINLGAGSWSHAKITARIMLRLEKYFLEQFEPDMVVVQGDTDSVLAASLVAVKMGIKVAHVEAGLRSYDFRMPEEVNRRIVDHISTFLFTPTQHRASILAREGVDSAKIHVTGNTIVDAILSMTPKINLHQERVLKELDIQNEQYIFLTLHRKENVDSPEILRDILEQVDKLSRDINKQIVFPIHPRTRKKIKEFGYYDLIKNWKVISPVGFLYSLILQKSSHMIFTDSGWLQEEGCSLGKKILVLRSSTEREEIIQNRCWAVAFRDFEGVKQAYEYLLDLDSNFTNPFWDGKAAKRILKILWID